MKAYQTFFFLIIAIFFSAIFFSACKDFSMTSDPAFSSDIRSGGGGFSIKAGTVTAGEWNDNDHWSFWTDLMKSADWQEKQEYWGFFPLSRCLLTLTSPKDVPICDALVTAEDESGRILWQSHTDNFGRTTF